MALPVSLDRRVQGLLLVAALWDLPLKSILSNRMKSTQQTLRHQLRQQIRKTQANLTALQQQQAEDSITQQALALIEERNAQHIALYISFDGEISTEKLIKILWMQGKQVYLPVLHPFNPNHLLFLRYLPETPMLKNKFGIWEPKLNVQNVLPLKELDILFTPLVAFDKQGNRLGMGGGFYDRTLQNWRNSSFIPVGLASSMSASRTTSNRSMGRATSSNLSCLNLSRSKI